ncbi:MAG: carbohydrate-binding protein [Opitutales bacterium]
MNTFIKAQYSLFCFLAGFSLAITPNNGHAQTIPYTGGRIAVSSDGNMHDDDDWGASAATLAIIASQSLQDKLVLYTYSDHVWGSENNDEAEMVLSVVETASRFDFTSDSNLMAAVEDPDAAYNAMRDAILASSMNDPLTVLAAGPMQVIGEALSRAQAIDPTPLQYVRVISHSNWNNRHSDNPQTNPDKSDYEEPHSGWTWNEMKSAFTNDGVVFDQIADQNNYESKTIGFATTRANNGYKYWDAWYFMRDYSAHTPEINDAIQFCYSRMEAVRRPDISDCGMAYYLFTGDEQGGPEGLKNMFDNGFAQTQQSLPGRIEAEDFDDGGQGVAYYDTTSSNLGGEFRDTAVDIQVASEGGYNVGWIKTGEYLDYTINVAQSGTYDFTFRVASGHNSNKSFHLELNNTNISGPISFNTGGAGWQSWQDFTAEGIMLSAGQQELRLYMDSASFNINYFEATLSQDPQTIRVEAEDFDNGPSGEAYFDTTAGNSGGKYRDTDVDIGDASEGNYTIGWIERDEYLNYTIDIPTTDTYDITFRVATAHTWNKKFHIELDGVDISGPITFNTGGAGWDVWHDVVATGVTLQSGNGRELRIVMDSPSFNINYFEITPSAQ